MKTFFPICPTSEPTAPAAPLTNKISSPFFYCPKVKFQKYKNNRLKEYEKIILDGYLLCYHKDFEDISLLSKIKNSRGFQYILSGGNKSQKDIVRFINYCKSFVPHVFL